MAKTNFQYEKRQRELAKKKKKEEKLQKKTSLPDGTAADGETVEGAEDTTTEPAAESAPSGS